MPRRIGDPFEPLRGHGVPELGISQYRLEELHDEFMDAIRNMSEHVSDAGEDRVYLLETDGSKVIKTMMSIGDTTNERVFLTFMAGLFIAARENYETAEEAMDHVDAKDVLGDILGDNVKPAEPAQSSGNHDYAVKAPDVDGPYGKTGINLPESLGISTARGREIVRITHEYVLNQFKPTEGAVVAAINKATMLKDLSKKARSNGELMFFANVANDVLQEFQKMQENPIEALKKLFESMKK